MPKLDAKVLVLLSPLVNADLLRKGLYHIRCHVEETTAVLPDEPNQDTPINVTNCQLIASPSAAPVKGRYPKAFVSSGNTGITKTVYIQYLQQNYVFSDWFLFDVSIPLERIPENIENQSAKITLSLKLCGCEKEEASFEEFVVVSQRSVCVNIQYNGGTHDYTDVLFDFVYMAAIGVNVHAVIVGMDTEDTKLQRPIMVQPPYTSKWSIFKNHTSLEPVVYPSFKHLLGKEPENFAPRQRSAGIPAIPPRAEMYKVTLNGTSDKYKSVIKILSSTYKKLRGISSDIISHCRRSRENVDIPNFPEIHIIKGAMESDIAAVFMRASASVATVWSYFSAERIADQNFLESLIYITHRNRVSYLSNSTVDVFDPSKMSLSRYSSIARETRSTLSLESNVYCKENTELPSEASIIFVEYVSDAGPLKLTTLKTGLPDVSPSKSSTSSGDLSVNNDLGLGQEDTPNSVTSQSLNWSFTDHTYPYLLCSITGATGHHYPSDVHLVICHHGLDGHHYDLKLYKTYLELALPQVTFDFLLIKGNQGNTFNNFETMTDQAVSEFREYMTTCMVSPTKISFIGHSLGNIVLRNMLTRAEMAKYLGCMHTFISICAPHLGTFVSSSSLVSTGMWFLQKWRGSQSLLQLQLRDHPDPHQTFIYQLSRKPTFEHFTTLLLVSSHQDKYVPFHSARLQLPEDANAICTAMLANIWEPIRCNKINVIRYTIDHSLQLSTNSFIGRAAHIAMLENGKFVEKFVILHSTKWFI